MVHPFGFSTVKNTWPNASVNVSECVGGNVANAHDALACEHRGPYCDRFDSGKVGRLVCRMASASGTRGESAMSSCGEPGSEGFGESAKCR